MENYHLHKKYALFNVVLCGIVPLLSLFPILLPGNRSNLMRMSEYDKWLLIFITGVAMLIMVVPTVASLIGFYLSGAIGKSRTAKNAFGLLIFSMTLSIAIISMAFFVDLAFVFDGLFTPIHPKHYRFTAILFFLNIFTQLIFFPILFTILALSAKTVKLWQRFIGHRTLV